jgi:RNA polymerase sigma-70 factor (ECF subfamily)
MTARDAAFEPEGVWGSASIPGLVAKGPLMIAKSPLAPMEGYLPTKQVGTSGYQSWTDLELVAACSDDCPDAYAELVRRHAGSVRAVVRMILGREDPCEDVVAEVFVRLWFAPEKFNPNRGTVLGYLRMSARARSIDLIRTESARRRREDMGRERPDPFADEVATGFGLSETNLAVRESVALLPPAERDPINLAFFSGLTYKQVAIELGLPEGTVKSRVRKGLARMRNGALLQHPNLDGRECEERAEA